MSNVPLFLNKGCCFIKCPTQITNKWYDIDWHQGENHDTLLNYPTASKKGTCWPSVFQISVAAPAFLGDQDTQCTNTISQGFMWHHQVSSHPAPIKVEKAKRMESVSCFTVLALFRARFPCASSCCVPHPMPHQPSPSSQKSKGDICSSFWEMKGNL